MRILVTRDKDDNCDVSVWTGAKANPELIFLNSYERQKYWHDSRYTPIEFTARDFKRLFGFLPKRGSSQRISIVTAQE